MRYLVTLLVVLGLGVGGYFLWKRLPKTAFDTSNVKPPSEAVVEKRSINFAVNAAGDIGPAEQVSVRPEVNGRIATLAVDISDRVKKGAELFTLDDRDLQIEKQTRETEITRARLQLEQAERNFKRSEELHEGQLISQELYEDSKTQYELAKNSLDRTQKDLELVVDRIRKTVIVAPFDCTVLTRPLSAGQAVSGSGGFNSGTEVMTIADLHEMVINAHINQADVTRLTVNQTVEVTVEAVPGLEVKGVVERIAPQATFKNNIKGFAARILLKDVDPRIRPGMTANIKVPVASAEDVVAAPLAAVFTETNKETEQTERYVYVKQGDLWERRPVQIGISDYFYAEVQKGLAAGETVAIEMPKEELRKEARQPEGTAKGGSPPGGGLGSRPRTAAGSASVH